MSKNNVVDFVAYKNAKKVNEKMQIFSSTISNVHRQIQDLEFLVNEQRLLSVTSNDTVAMSMSCAIKEEIAIILDRLDCLQANMVIADGSADVVDFNKAKKDRIAKLAR